MSQVDLGYIASVIEKVLNKPFSKELSSRPFDKIQGIDLYTLGNEVHREHLETFEKECRDAVSGMFSDEFKPKLRVSTLGKSGLLQGLSHLGIADKGMDNFYLALQGHLLECVVRFTLRCRGFEIEYHDGFYSNKVEYMGIEGHPDFVLKSPKGRRIVCEVKCASGSFLDGFLEPERIYNERTGNQVKSGNRLSKLNTFCDSNDYRGYIEQLSVYSNCLGLDALWIIWDKEKNRYHVVPLDNDVRVRALARVDAIIPKIREIRNIDDLLDTFSIPQPQAQISRGMETGLFYVPFEMRFTRFKDIFYETYQIQGKEYAKRIRSREEIKGILEREA